MPATVRRMIGVYDADGTVLGELSYFLRAHEVRRAANGETPVLVAEATDDQLFVVMGRDALEECHGSPEALVEQLDAALPTGGLEWPHGTGV